LAFKTPQVFPPPPEPSGLRQPPSRSPAVGTATSRPFARPPVRLFPVQNNPFRYTLSFSIPFHLGLVLQCAQNFSPFCKPPTGLTGPSPPSLTNVGSSSNSCASFTMCLCSRRHSACPVVDAPFPTFLTVAQLPAQMTPFPRRFNPPSLRGTPCLAHPS